MQIITAPPPQGHSEINNLGHKSRFAERPRTAGTLPVWQPKSDFAAHLNPQSSPPTPVFTHTPKPQTTQNLFSARASTPPSPPQAAPIQPSSAQPSSAPSVASPSAQLQPAPAQSTSPAANPAPSLADLIDIINPLHHLPIIGHIYRHITGDEISPVARFAGGALFGGPLGAGSALATIAFNDIRNSQNDSQNSVAAGFNGPVNPNAQNPNFTLKQRYQFDKMPRMAGTTHIAAQNMRETPLA